MNKADRYLLSALQEMTGFYKVYYRTVDKAHFKVLPIFNWGVCHLKKSKQCRANKIIIHLYTNCNTVNIFCLI